MTTRELLIKINGDNSGLNNALIKSGEQLKAIEKNAKATAAVFTDFGKRMTMSVTLPIAALGTAMVVAASESEKATALLANAIKAVGNEGEVSVKALSDYADELQRTTKYDDEVTLGAMRMLESLTGLNEKGLKEIIPKVQDFASAWGMDLEQAASLVGKTIASGTNALARYGIEVDSAAPKTEKYAQIMQALERYAGTAATEGKTFAGQLAILKNEAGQLAEDFGNELLPLLTDLIKKVRDVVAKFSDMPEGTKKTILAVMGVAAAIGPVVLGVGKLIETINILKGVMLLAGGAGGWIMIAAAAFVALGAAIYYSIKADNDWRNVMSGESKKSAQEQVKYLEDTIATIEKDIAKLEKVRQKVSFKNLTGTMQKQIIDDIENYNKRLAQAKEKKAELEKLTGAVEENNGVIGNGILLLKDATEAEKAYADAIAMANDAIEANLSDEEKLGRQFDILQNLKTTSEEDEKKRLAAMLVLRQQIFDIQMKNMAALSEENIAITPSLEEGIEATHEYSAGLKQLLKEVPTLEEDAKKLEEDAKKLKEEAKKLNKELSGVASEMIQLIGPTVELATALGADAESMQELGDISTDVIKGLAAGLQGDIVGAAAAAMSALSKLINVFKKNHEAALEAKKTTVDYLDVLTSLEVGLIQTASKMNELNQQYEDMNGFQKFFRNFTKASDDARKKATAEFEKAFEALSASYGNDVGKALGDGIVNGLSKVDFMAAIGKILIDAMISAALTTGPIATAMAAIGEKISYMVINGFSEGSMAEVEAMASNLYDTFSGGVLPVVQRVRDIFGVGGSSGATAEGESIGSFASGVTNFRGGIARVGEQGPETVRLPRGASVEPYGNMRGGISMTFNSPRALSPMETKRAMLAAGRQLAFETGGNF